MVFFCEIHVPAKGVLGICLRYMYQLRVFLVFVCEIHVPAKGVTGICL